ncbi:hypothetical protein [Phyllobacterium lublinensis]|jgi:hypothetical protein|uniref:hypothetical protein n=1 Tax=Phyllobacterium lublinensis TaxID=2875708 RepID=UPI001CCCEA95|nr:hypothetical protein [Phyllobacterium sp. 2063]MBZ9653587.1 hypothetical protein [Phyllobacterium sp. 2063]
MAAYKSMLTWLAHENALHATFVELFITTTAIIQKKFIQQHFFEKFSMKMQNSIILYMSSLTILLAASFAFAGCTSAPMRSMQWKKNLQDPTYKKTILESCIHDFKARSQDDRENLATLARVPVEHAPSVVCKRVLDAVANGRLSAMDMESASSSHLPPKILKVIVGN